MSEVENEENNGRVLPCRKQLGCRCFTDTATVPEMESWLTGTTEATNCVQAALVAGVGLLALVDVCKTDGWFFFPNVSVTTNAQGRALAHLCS